MPTEHETETLQVLKDISAALKDIGAKSQTLIELAKKATTAAESAKKKW